MFEMPFYGDVVSAKKMKTSMTLDLSKPREDKLSVPGSDIDMFITTPELERLITQNSNFLLTTPTPTTNHLFPKMVTEEQEAFAKGFNDALGKLKKNDDFTNPISSTIGNIAITNQAFPKTTLPKTLENFNNKIEYPVSSIENNVQSSSYNNLNIIVPTTNAFHQSRDYFQTDFGKPIDTSVSNILNQSNNIVSKDLESSFYFNKQNSTSNNFNAFNNITPQNMQYHVIKSEAYHMVPKSPASVSSHSSGASPLNLRNNKNNVSPINLEDQEYAKLERKRERNRIAATKCRNRKLERISRLEERVRKLKEQNSNLIQSSQFLKEQVKQLKNTIINHTNQGCQVMLTSKFLDSNLDFS